MAAWHNGLATMGFFLMVMASADLVAGFAAGPTVQALLRSPRSPIVPRASSSVIGSSSGGGGSVRPHLGRREALKDEAASRARIGRCGESGDWARQVRGRAGSDWSLWAMRGPASTASSSAFGVGNSTVVSASQGLLTDLSPEASLAGEGGEGEGDATTSGEIAAGKRQNFLRTLWEFSRPHTMIGTAIAIPAMGAFAAPPGIWPGGRFVLATLWALVPSLLINVYITGLNQITDVGIDMINKPYLPIPAGNLSPRAAKSTVTLCLLAGMVLGLAPTSLGSPALALTVVLSVLIGTSYSLPPLRLKRFPQVAAMCILAVRGSVINGGFYAHYQAAAYGLATENTVQWALTLPLRDAKFAFALAYFTVFAVVIALMKDVPDVAGDRKFNIPSFSVVLGEATLFAFARRLLTGLLWSTSIAVGLGAKAAFGAGMPFIAVSRGLVAVAALLSGQLVQRRASGIDPKQPKEVYGFYMFLWKIFYASYFFLPFAR